jgi:diaminohydroxyphosphoribosylaminopyrimidine deaminase / 5-amino-6-(5-phosphoribosylamino)uracil reductase
MNDHVYMQRCLELAALGLGNAAPNPLVGCVIVHDDKIVGEGYHHQAGEPHAEVNAIHSVRDKDLLSKSTLYVNLEPCAHHGKTPPCANLIIQNNIPKVVIGNVDPHEKVAGKGIEILENNGTEVVTGMLGDHCRHLNRRFFCFQEKKRPYVVLKWAQTMDGFIDRDRQPDEKPHPNWITGECARMLVHKWRAEEQSIMVGTKTAILDNPRLNVRNWSGRNPVRLLVDRNGKTNDSHFLLNDEILTYIFTENVKTSKARTHFIRQNFNENLLQEILHFLYEKEIQSVFVEGGASLINSFIFRGLWDEARVFIGEKEFKSGVKAPLIDKQATKKIKINDDLFYYYLNH